MGGAISRHQRGRQERAAHEGPGRHTGGPGSTDVKTYIQSGNAIFRKDEPEPLELAERLADAVSERFAFRPSVVVLSDKQFRKAVASNPFPEAEPERRSLHLFFLSRPPPSPDLDGLNAAKSDSESFILTEEVFYLHAPDGIGRSKLVQRAERLIGVDVTARNWNTVTKLLELSKTY